MEFDGHVKPYQFRLYGHRFKVICVVFWKITVMNEQGNTFRSLFTRSFCFLVFFFVFFVLTSFRQSGHFYILCVKEINAFVTLLSHESSSQLLICVIKSLVPTSKPNPKAQNSRYISIQVLKVYISNINIFLHKSRLYILYRYISKKIKQQKEIIIIFLLFSHITCRRHVVFFFYSLTSINCQRVIPSLHTNSRKKRNY